MKYLITDKELLDYVSGSMDCTTKRQLEQKAIKLGQTDLLLYAQLADYAATGTSTDDIIGEDTFMQDETSKIWEGSDILSFPKAAEIIRPPRDDENKP